MAVPVSIALPQAPVKDSVTAELTVRLLALLEKMREQAEAEDVHHLRTTVRRLEVHLPDPRKKITRALRSLRKEAGTVRDLDVHLALLNGAPFRGRSAAAAAVRAQLHHALHGARAHEEKELLRRIAEAAPVLETRLPLAAQKAHTRAPGLMAAKAIVTHAREGYLRLARVVPEDAAKLHDLRIATKKLRYSLEPVTAFPEAQAAFDQLKRVQDAIGAWHDWATLLAIADRELHAQRATPAFHAIEARTQREYARARRTAQQAWLCMAQAQGSPRAGRKVYSILDRDG